MNTVTVDNLLVKIYKSREEMGAVAAKDAAKRINKIIAQKGEANVIFAAAPSQNELLEGLLQSDVDWSRVRGFHQDEYVGINPKEPAGFGNFLDRAIFKRVRFMNLYYLLCEDNQVLNRCKEYTELLKKYPADLIFLGIGENGHLAFNDPAMADFHDTEWIKVVELDEVCRQQQVNDGCFKSIDKVPNKAMTLTMSYILQVPQAVCVVPTVRKANAVFNALNGPVSEGCPASALRIHPNAVLYLDSDSASQL